MDAYLFVFAGFTTCLQASQSPGDCTCQVRDSVAGSLEDLCGEWAWQFEGSVAGPGKWSRRYYCQS